jgi:prolipoprotein diacylglyceryltransferase
MGMFSMNEKQRAKWERTRAKGMFRFVVLYGVMFAVGLSFATSVFDYFTSSRGFQPEDLIFEIPIYLISGLITGTAIWLVAESQYKKNSGPK